MLVLTTTLMIIFLLLQLYTLGSMLRLMFYEPDSVDEKLIMRYSATQILRYTALLGIAGLVEAFDWRYWSEEQRKSNYERIETWILNLVQDTPQEP